MHRKFYLILLILLFSAWRPLDINENYVPLSPQDDPRAGKEFVYIAGSQFYLHGEPYKFKGMNYYPSKNSWQKMWADWDPAAINTELALLENIGVNTVRVFLDYDLFERNRKYGNNSMMLARLDELLGICDAHGMRALVTPFVWGRANTYTDRLHIRHIAERFKDDKRIFAWDVSNELDHNWHGIPSRREALQKWAAAIFNEIKAIDGNHPVTAGDYGWFLGDRSDPYGSGIALDLSEMSVPLEKLDFVCFHWYEHYYALQVALKKIKDITGKPVVIEEIGLPTGGMQDKGVPWYLSEDEVAIYYVAWLTAAANAGAYAMPWCGFDYAQGESPFAKDSFENYFGMYAVDYRLKANGTAFRDFSLEGRRVMRLLYGLPPLKKLERSLINFQKIKEDNKRSEIHVDR